MDSQNAYQATLSEREREFTELEKALEATEKNLAETAAEYKSLSERKICYNPAHCYLPEILNSVKIYQGEKNELLVRVGNLENSLRRETERIRAMTAEQNAFTEEKTRILNRLR